MLTRAYEEAQSNPDFTVDNNELVSKLIKDINLFSVKLDYLKTHGPQIPSFNH